MALTQERKIDCPEQLVPLVFMQDAVAASQSAVALTVAEVTSAAGNAATSYCMPWAGQIVGISLSLSAAGTAGNLSVAPTKGGTALTDPVAAVTTAAFASDTALRGGNTFAANDLIGAKLTTDGSWDGTSADIVVVVFVVVTMTLS